MSFWKSRKVLVTGGCGFVGSYLVEELVAEGSEVTVVDNLSSGRLENLSPVADKVRFIQGDLIDFNTCLQCSREIEVVMNLVGKVSGVSYSSLHHGEMLFHNTVTHLNILEAARQNNVERFLLVSSCCIYPDGVIVPTPELPTMTGLPEKANEGYGWAKRISELQAQYYAREAGMKIAICRPFNLYGKKYLWKEEIGSHVIPALVKKVMDGNDPLVVWGSGKQRRTFLHARDAARLMMLITEKYFIAEPVNIGYGDDISVIELLSLICKIAGKQPKVTFDHTKPEGQFRKCADPSLLRKISDNYEPKIKLESGLQEMIEWYYQAFRKG